MISIREVNTEDAAILLDIYRYYVENTAISFELVTPSLEEFSSRINQISKHYPYLVIEDNGLIRGYAYASAFHERKAYEHSAELSIYLHREASRKGLGSLLYEKMEEILKTQRIYNLYACIAHTEDLKDPYLTNRSELFHQALQFKLIGCFNSCGYKFNRWYDMVWMEKIIQDHPLDSEDFLTFQDVKKQINL